MPLAAIREPVVGFVVVGAGVPISTDKEEAHAVYLWGVARGEPRPFPRRHVLAADLLVENYTAPLDGYDPTPVLEEIDIPVLWIFGLYDDVIPTTASIHAIGELHRSGMRNHHVEVLPFSDHNFRNVFTGERYDLVAVVEGWLHRRELLR